MAIDMQNNKLTINNNIHTQNKSKPETRLFGQQQARLKQEPRPGAHRG